MADFTAFLSAVDADPRVELHSLLALHRGRVVAEAYWEPWRAEDSVHVYSVSKTITGSAVGIAVGEGRFGLHDSVAWLLDPGRPVHPRIAEITVHHLLSMSTGHTTDAMVPEGVDPVDQFFADVPPEPVGSCHTYNNLASWLLGELVRRASGQTLMDYLRPRLFDPLGIDPTWEVDPLGRELGFAGLHLRTPELARIGELYRLGGTWEGRQLIPAEYVAEAGRRQIPTGPGEDYDWTTGYGYQVWISREGYRLDGAYGQFCLVLPEREAVIALTSAQPHSQPLLDLVFEHLVPAVADGSPMEAPMDLQVAPVPDDDGSGPWWAESPEAVPELEPRLSSVRLSRMGAGWEFSASVAGRPIRLALPGNGWHRLGPSHGPVAASAGTSGGVGRVLLAFTDTAHILEVEVGEGSGSQTWRTVPLGVPPLAEFLADNER